MDEDQEDVDTADVDDQDSGDTGGITTNAAPKPINPLVQALLANKSQYQNQQAGLQQAQQQAAQNRLVAGITGGLAQIGQGISRAPGQANLAPSQAMMKEADAPVQNFEAQTKAAASDAAHDPNSPQSKAFRASVKFLQPAYGDAFDKITAADAPLITKVIETKANIDARQDVAQTRADAITQSKAASVQAAQDKVSAKQATDQDKSYTQLRKDLETFRGNRPAAQAAMDVYSANKALALLKDRDPNTLTTQELNLFSNELGKIASGGIPGEHGVQALVPNTYRTKYAELASFLSNKPTDAQAGAFVKKNLNYLSGMVDEAQGRVNSFRSNLAKGYKNRVKPEDYEEALSDYGLNQGASGAAPQAAPTLPPHGMTVQQNGHTYTWNPETKAYE